MSMAQEKLDQWFGQLPRNDDTPRPVEEQALRDFLTGGTNVDDTAERLNSAVADAPDAEDKLYEIWRVVDQAAEDLPDTQEKLIALLTTLKNLPDLTIRGQPVEVYNDRRVWKDLPLLAEDIRTQWECKWEHLAYHAPCKLYLALCMP